MENTNIKEYQSRLIDELIEDKEFDQKIIKSFYSQNTLSFDIFENIGNKFYMNEGVRNKLLHVSDAFLDFIGVKIFVYDVILTGSLANYNWSEFSDIDLHILVDLSEIVVNDKNPNLIKSIMSEFFESKKNNWNASHHIKVKNYDVEIYVQDINEKHFASGVYSILNDKWLIIPQKGKNNIDEKMIIDKGEEYSKIIDDLISKSESGTDISSEVNDVRKKLKKFRQSGLEQGGEYSYENLTFKLLRRNGYIEKLLDLSRSVLDKKLSLYENVEYDYSDVRRLESAALEHYGETTNLSATGFITPSGYLLDFSYKTGRRVEDHRNISFLFDELGIDIKGYEDNNYIGDGTKGLYAVMDMGFIRWHPESDSLDISIMPTQEQFQVIREIIRQKKGKVAVEIREKTYAKYERGTPEEYILNGIKNYFKHGVKLKSYMYADDEDEY